MAVRVQAGVFPWWCCGVEHLPRRNRMALRPDTRYTLSVRFKAYKIPIYVLRKCAKAEVRRFQCHSKSDSRIVDLLATADQVAAFGGPLLCSPHQSASSRRCGLRIASSHVNARRAIELFQPQCHVEHLLRDISCDKRFKIYIPNPNAVVSMLSRSRVFMSFRHSFLPCLLI